MAGTASPAAHFSSAALFFFSPFFLKNFLGPTVSSTLFQNFEKAKSVHFPPFMG
jgi:hypothetical protein